MTAGGLVVAVLVVRDPVTVVPAVVDVAEVEVDAVAAAAAVDAAAADAAARLEVELARGVVTTIFDYGGVEPDRRGDDVVTCVVV